MTNLPLLSLTLRKNILPILKVNLEERWGHIFNGVCSDRTTCNLLKNNSKTKEGRLELYVRKKFFHDEGGERLEQGAQRGGGYPVPGNIQGQA